MWDLSEDSWWADGPVLLDFGGGARLELIHNKFDDLSVTWNTIDVGAPLACRGDEGLPSRLGWNDSAPPELVAHLGGTVRDVEILSWAGGELAAGSVGVGVELTSGQVVVANGLDENELLFGPKLVEWTTGWSTCG
jgi:hypothetical protein